MLERENLKNVQTAAEGEKSCRVSVEYHADDYGMFPSQSRRILECHTNGRLNGISVMPNGPELDRCMDEFAPFSGEIAVSVHLNLIEGCCLSDPKEVPLLADETGVLRGSFGSLLLHSYLPGRNAYREQLKKELSAQIHAVQSRMETGAPLRLDGHAHYHMLPVVFDAMMDVIREEKLEVSYIRIPREYPSLYLRHLGKLRDFSAINLVKVLILNLLTKRAEAKYGEILKGMTRKVFLGVFLSGRMYRENMAPILPEAVRLAQKLGQDLEILAHPGGVYEQEDIARLTCAEDVAFLTSDMREQERSLFELA